MTPADGTRAKASFEFGLLRYVTLYLEAGTTMLGRGWKIVGPDDYGGLIPFNDPRLRYLYEL